MTKRSLAVPTAFLALALALTGCGGDSGSPSPEAGGTTTSATADGHNDADVMFAQMMIPHHAQAVRMSELLLDTPGVGERTRKLAQDIKAAQQPEIDRMAGWLRDWGAPVPATDSTGETMDHSGHGGGMMSEEDLKALDDATGQRAERLFLEQMIRHHEGAITMARDQVGAGAHPGAVELARAIAGSQEAEVATMRSMLAGG